MGIVQMVNATNLASSHDCRGPRLDASDGRLPAKVRAAVTREIPLTLVVGRREAEQQTVSVRYRCDEETAMTVDAFVDHALTLVRSKSLPGAGHLWRTNKADGQATPAT
jgi:threonyl-tRNA synthetase